MTTKRQFIACKFRTTDAKSFTYHNDGPRVAVGDQVKVPPFRGDGWVGVTVSAIDVEPPTKFETKAILGKVEGADHDARILDADDKRGKIISAKTAKPKPAATGDLFA